jgi:hypothetical protein
MRTALAGMLLLLLAADASARRLPGSWTNVYQGGGGRLRFIGRLDSSSGTVQGRLKCRRCPVKGPFRPTCTGNGSFWDCRGPVGPAANGCTGSGFLYSSVFEGTWECGPGAGGVLGFGRR